MFVHYFFDWLPAGVNDRNSRMNDQTTHNLRRNQQQSFIDSQVIPFSRVNNVLQKHILRLTRCTDHYHTSQYGSLLLPNALLLSSTVSRFGCSSYRLSGFHLHPSSLLKKSKREAKMTMFLCALMGATVKTIWNVRWQFAQEKKSENNKKFS